MVCMKLHIGLRGRFSSELEGAENQWVRTMKTDAIIIKIE